MMNDKPEWYKKPKMPDVVFEEKVERTFDSMFCVMVVLVMIAAGSFFYLGYLFGSG